MTGGPKGEPTACWSTVVKSWRCPTPKAFPGKTPTRPVRIDLGELFPLASHYFYTVADYIRESRSVGMSEQDRIEVLLHVPVNSFMGSFGDFKK